MQDRLKITLYLKTAVLAATFENKFLILAVLKSDLDSGVHRFCDTLYHLIFVGRVKNSTLASRCVDLKAELFIAHHEHAALIIYRDMLNL